MATKEIASTNRISEYTDEEKIKFVREAIRSIVLNRKKEKASFFNFNDGTSTASWRGARKGKHNEDWQISEETADYELMDSLAALRFRCRQLTKDNGLAEGTIIAYVGMSVGEGPKITSRAKKVRAAQQIQTVLDEWRKNCDITGEKSLTEVLENIVTGSCTDGDLLINLPIDKTIPSDKIQTRIQLVEADRISTPTDKSLRKSEKIRHGIEYDAQGKVIGYWVRDLGVSEIEHTYNYKLQTSSEGYTFMPKFAKDGRQITWLFKRPGGVLRPGQSRQVPLFASCLDILKDMEDIMDAHIIGSRAAACIMAFIKSDSSEEIVDALLEDAATGNQLEDKFGRKYSKLQPASIIPLKTGEELQGFDPKRSSGDVEPLILRLAKFLSMKVRIPYPVLFLDLSEINYSSYRGGILEARRVFSRWRRSLQEDVISPILESIVTEAFLKGMIPGAIDLTPDVLFPRVDFPAWGYIDQEKEAKAESLMIEKGLSSHPRIAAEHGENWEEILQEEIDYKLKKKEKMKEAGLKEEKPPANNTPTNTNNNDSKSKEDKREEDLDQ